MIEPELDKTDGQLNTATANRGGNGSGFADFRRETGAGVGRKAGAHAERGRILPAACCLLRRYPQRRRAFTEVCS